MPNVSVVIPTIADSTPLTYHSVPDGVETTIVRRGNRAEARNIGATRTNGDILVFCDDDIRFDSDWFWYRVDALEQGEIRGLEDFGAGYLLTRFLAIHSSDFDKLGGFDPSLHHMEDTEFCIRAEQQGMNLKKLPRAKVEHEPHANDVTTTKRVKALGYLTRRYRSEMLPVIRRVVK